MSIGYFIIIGYVITIFIAYGIILYYGESYNVDDELSAATMAIFWPCVLCAFIIMCPFALITKLVHNIKKHKNKKINIDIYNLSKY